MKHNNETRNLIYVINIEELYIRISLDKPQSRVSTFDIFLRLEGSGWLSCTAHKATCLGRIAICFGERMSIY